MSHRLRRALVLLLIAVVPVQGLYAGVSIALGPSHTHVAAPSEPVELVDVRREPVVAQARGIHVATAFGHFHSSTAARHYHARSDTTVVLDDGGLSQQAGLDDLSSLHATSLLFATLLPHIPAVESIASRCDVAEFEGWASSTHEPSLLERPPRRG